MRYNCAVIGLGQIGYRFNLDTKRKGTTWTHVDAYKKCGHTALVGAVEVDRRNARTFKRNNPNIPVYNTIADLFRNHKIDLVSICVPTERHFPVFSELMKYNIKAVFCEKPVSYSIKESEKMLGLSMDKGIVSAVNYSRRWQDSYNMVADMVRNGEIGKINTVNSFYPGQIYNIGSHLFDTLIFVLAFKPLMVSALITRDGEDPSVSGWFRCENDEFVTFSSTGKREDLIFEIDIIGDKGRIRVTDNGSNVELFLFEESKRFSGYRELAFKKIKQPPHNDSFVNAILDITQVLEGRRKRVKCSIEDALLVDRIIEKTLISAKRNGAPQTIC